MTSRAPRRPPPRPPSPGFPGVLFTRANRPFTLVLILAIGALGGYLALGGGGGQSTAPTTSQAVSPSTGSTVAGDGTGGTTGSTTEAGPGTEVVSEVQLGGLAASRIAGGFAFPVFAASPPGDARIFVVERAGRIKVVDAGGSVLGTPFLDISDRIDSASGVELGLLGLAFHPGFSTNGRFFVHYTDLSADNVVAEFALTAGSETADPDSEEVLLTVDQVGFRHRGGMLEFGPDGYLYVAIGDGTEMDVNPQNLETLPGSILRLDVDGGSPYAIPPGNPFAAGDGRDEIWAYGLRNPWRFSIDPLEGRIYIGDVGEESWEEIDVVSLANAGANFGWPAMEGSTCYTDADCGSRTDLVRPVLEYPHEGQQCAVTGGYVYRGTAIPELVGHYFYADWCTGFVKSFLFDGENVTRPQDWSASLGDDLGSIDSFGVDGSGELLLVTSDSGNLYRLVPER